MAKTYDEVVNTCVVTYCCAVGGGSLESKRRFQDACEDAKNHPDAVQEWPKLTDAAKHNWKPKGI